MNRPRIPKIRLLLAAAVFLLPLACRGDAEAAAAVSSATRRKGPTARTLLREYMPEAMADGVVKIAVVYSAEAEDHGGQFLEGCVSEGRSLGFTVDAFAVGDDDRRRRLIANIAAADYDGLILYHGLADGGAAYIRGILQPAVEQGLKIVTFVSLPSATPLVSADDPPPDGITSTFADDAGLAELSLAEIRSRFGGRDGRPPRIIRVWPAIPSEDRRQERYDRLAGGGKIREAALIRPGNPARVRRDTAEALAAILPRLPPGSVDAVWTPNGGCAWGCVDALREAGREDVKIVSMGISGEDIKMMLDNAAVWLCSTGVDSRLTGIVNMRILAVKLAGEQTPAAYTFGAQIIQTAGLNRAVNMANIALMVPGWGRADGLFDRYPWMAALKSAGGKYLRIAPVFSPGPAYYTKPPFSAMVNQ
jgi:simple sugar transport system substrate-binding protein